MRANFSKSARFEERSGTFEEGNYGLKQRSSFSNDEHQRSIPFAVRFDVATTESVANQLEHLSPVAILADMELRH